MTLASSQVAPVRLFSESLGDLCTKDAPLSQVATFPMFNEESVREHGIASVFIVSLERVCFYGT